MLAAERQKKIIELIREQGSVQVEQLAQQLNVSTMTIRRDLVKLQKDAQIQRCHGGAVMKEEITYAEKQSSNTPAKQRIAQYSRNLVKEGDCVFLDAGTTTYEIAKQIKSIPGIIIVTNDLEIALLLKNSEASVFICGGEIQKSTGSVFCYHAMNMLNDFRFDAGFFGAACVNEHFEVMTPTSAKLRIKREIPKKCTCSYLVVDDSKFEKQAMTCINHLSDYTAVITDRAFNEEERVELKKHNINAIEV